MDKINLNWKIISMILIPIAIIMLIFDNNQNPKNKMQNKVYKILKEKEWNTSKKKGVIETNLDSTDGFVHLSTAQQLAGTLHYYFNDDESLILLQFNSNELTDALIFEEPIVEGKRKGKFPHYYSKLETKKISNFWEIKRGAFILPEEIILVNEN